MSTLRAVPEPAPAAAPIAVRAAAPAAPPVPTAGGLTWRAWTRDDVPALAALMRTVEEADGRDWFMSPEEVAELLAAPHGDPATDTLVGLDADGALVAHAYVERSATDGVDTLRAELGGGVHPGRRGEGIGTELLAWAVGRARQVLAASGTDDRLAALPGRIALHLEDSDPAERVELARAAGFTPIRFYANLVRDLAEPIPAIGVEPPLRIVPWSDALEDAVRLARNDAFRDHWGSQPRTPESWRAYRSMFAPQWSFVVVDDSVDYPGSATELPGDESVPPGTPYVVGLHRAERYEHDWETQGYTAGYTGLLGVRRAYRGRRVAAALLTHAMRVYAADGMQKAELDVDTANPTGATGLYARLGYTKNDGSTLYTIEL
ncbi:GNAT family N-acetyltransferase [Promicromonospora thailandica]|uniref:Ribosomal protein S18 acetylase RimI n=1 Tax=Promicromonospora thailandica TaxID=765201 RepID=A0A9X2G4M8_9MICO|nr:GNAT family N-acetyltransferase [Promicromonospora thailandica]MCP2265670.1 Ribosomal protein S18 acetylase RimI [Promicromonospora thailandica]